MKSGAFGDIDCSLPPVDPTTCGRAITEYRGYLRDRADEEREFYKVRHRMRMDQMAVYEKYRSMLNEDFNIVAPQVQEKVARNILEMSGHVAPTKTEISIRHEQEQKAALAEVQRNLISGNILDAEYTTEDDDEDDDNVDYDDVPDVQGGLEASDDQNDSEDEE